MKKILMQLLIVMALCSLVACSGAKKDRHLGKRTTYYDYYCKPGDQCPPYDEIHIDTVVMDGEHMIYRKDVTCSGDKIGKDGKTCRAYDTILEASTERNKNGEYEYREKSCILNSDPAGCSLPHIDRYGKIVVPHKEGNSNYIYRIEERSKGKHVIHVARFFQGKFDEMVIEKYEGDSASRICHADLIGKNGKSCLAYDEIEEESYGPGDTFVTRSCHADLIDEDGKSCKGYDSIEEKVIDSQGERLEKTLKCTRDRIDLNGNCISYDEIIEFDAKGSQFYCGADKIDVARKACAAYDEIREARDSNVRVRSERIEE